MILLLAVMLAVGFVVFTIATALTVCAVHARQGVHAACFAVGAAAGLLLVATIVLGA